MFVLLKNKYMLLVLIFCLHCFIEARVGERHSECQKYWQETLSRDQEALQTESETRLLVVVIETVCDRV